MAAIIINNSGLDMFSRQHIIGTSGSSVYLAADTTESAIYDLVNSQRVGSRLGALRVMKRSTYCAQKLEILVHIPFHFVAACDCEEFCSAGFQDATASKAVYEIDERGEFIYAFANGFYDSKTFNRAPTSNRIEAATTTLRMCLEPVDRNASKWIYYDRGQIHAYDTVTGQNLIHRPDKGARKMLKNFSSLYLRSLGAKEGELALTAGPQFPSENEAKERFSRFVVFNLRLNEAKNTFSVRLYAKSVKLPAKFAELERRNCDLSDVHVSKSASNIVIQRMFGSIAMNVFIGTPSLRYKALIGVQELCSKGKTGFDVLSQEDVGNAFGYALEIREFY